jgi:hypothetical protein
MAKELKTEEELLPADRSYTPNEFCAAERMSRAKLFDDWAKNRGPRYYWNGNTRRITHQARLDWQHEREAEAAASQTVEAA